MFWLFKEGSAIASIVSLATAMGVFDAAKLSTTTDNC